MWNWHAIPTVVDDYAGLAPLFAERGKGGGDRLRVGEIGSQMQRVLRAVLALE